MTCVVGIRTTEGIVLAADSLGASSHVAETRIDPKLFDLGSGIAIGITGSYRMGQVICAHFELPPRSMDAWTWAVKLFVPELRRVLSEHGVAKRENEVTSMDDGSFLLAAGGNLFYVGSDYQVGEHACGYAAVGSGAAVALGALHALIEGDPGMSLSTDDARAFASAAIDAAEEHTPFVRGPVRMVEVGLL